VELLPIQEFNEMEYYQAGDRRQGLRNFWGYSTVAFFAPNGRYAAAGVGGAQVREFKELVLALHKAGIEVILDVVFNHTAEGGRDGPTYSFRGVDNNAYYIMHRAGKTYANYTGCGNTVNCNHPLVRQFILDCLRYWVREMHVDGFRFDLASIFARGRDGHVVAQPPIINAIAEDPVLRHAKLIAEPWDAAGLYQVGSFPHPHWSEWNGKYRDDVRRFWRGDEHRMGTFASRITGSADLYQKPGQTPLKSINFVTAHDGFTLADLVSYRGKHNHANCEDNHDGEKENHSSNHGHEGPSHDPDIQALRQRQMRNFLVTLMVSRGVPMLLAGDEFGRTQRGSNNAYCQDNEMSWLDWSLAKKNQELLDFTRRVIELRKRYPVLRKPAFYLGHMDDGGEPDIRWVGPNGGDPDWQHGKSLGCVLSGLPHHTGADTVDDTLLILFHAGAQSETFTLPAPPGHPWERVLSTEDGRTEGTEIGDKTTVEGRSVHVLRSRPG
jgi:glycogen operon protein